MKESRTARIAGTLGLAILSPKNHEFSRSHWGPGLLKRAAQLGILPDDAESAQDKLNEPKASAVHKW